MTVPILTTERLILREHRLDDFPAYAAMRADPQVMRFLGKGETYTEEESWSKFLQTIGHWHMMGYGTWAIEERAGGKHVGNLGFTDKKRPAEHPASGAPEMGWLLAADAQGKGYATEAVQAALAWARAHFGPVRAVCVISNDNQASIRLAEKCGFRQFAAASRYGLPRLVFERML